MPALSKPLALNANKLVIMETATKYVLRLHSSSIIYCSYSSITQSVKKAKTFFIKYSNEQF